MTARRRLAALGLALPLLAFAAPAPALAAGIVVSTLGDVANGSDGACSLREAISAARTNGASGGVAGECPAGAASDTITFSVSGMIELSSSLPSIGDGTTIDGADEIIIDGAGHGIFLGDNDADVTIRRLVLLGAGATYGPAMYIGGTSRIDRVTVMDSHASEWGGGLLVGTDANLTVTDSTFDGNSAKFGGGIYVAGGATAVIVGTTISGNASLGAGGGIYGTSAAQVTVVNSTVYGNGGDDGAGIYMSNTDLAVRNSTITGNESAGGGGGLSIDSAPLNVMVNSIVTGNTDETGGTSTDDIWGTLDTDTANLIGAEAAGVLDPAGLADNGGRTATVRLLPTAAAAIDAGNDSTCAGDGVEGVDQRGLARPATACDIGAVERDLVAPVMAGNPTGTLASTTLEGAKARVELRWRASDTGIGLGTYLVESSVQGGPWNAVRTVRNPELAVALPAKGARYRVTPIDLDGNAGTPTVSRTLRADLTQQTYGGITYTKRWRTSTSSAYSGGSVRRASEKGASARFLFTGRGVGFVTTTAPNRGKARIYINGSLVDTVDLGGATKDRVVAWTKTWSSSATRTIKVVVVGTSGRPRVDVDAFVVLR
jgi:CSLREA domain-containing protein